MDIDIEKRSRIRLASTVESVTEIAQAWNDVSIRVEFLIDSKCVYLDIWELRRQSIEALWSRDNAAEGEGTRAKFADLGKCVFSRATGRKHWVEKNHIGTLDWRELLIVGRGNRCLFIALHSEVANLCEWHELQGWVKHGNTSAKDWHKDEIVLDGVAFCLTEGSLDLLLLELDVTCGFEEDDWHDLRACLSELVHGAVTVPQDTEGLLGDGMLDQDCVFCFRFSLHSDK